MHSSICLSCQSPFEAKRKGRKFCSRSCLARYNFRSHQPWNKGLTKGEDPRLIRVGKPQSEESKEKLRQKALERGIGGYKPGSGRGKKGWYKGVWCDSSWELAYLVYQESLGVSVERNKERFRYTSPDGKEHSYLPDFLVDGVLIEVKGWGEDTVEVQTKQRAVGDRPYRLLGKQDMKPILDYVIQMHGKDFIKLYGEFA